MEGLRRSKRHFAVCYDSNGRDCVADQLGLNRTQLEAWLASSTVHPHLLTWYNLCILGRKRFRDGREWIESGDDGYYYNKSDLEADLLLMCLEEGNIEELEEVAGGFSDYGTGTSSWPTQQIWARTVWRIVQGNRGPGQVFEKQAVAHPAAAYGAIIDLLTAAFHSIAFRAGGSIWHSLILNGDCADMLLAASSPAESIPIVAKEIELDQDSDANDSEEDFENDSDGGSYITVPDSDRDDEDFEEPQTPPKKKKTAQPSTPQAPKKTPTYRYQLQEWVDSTASDCEDGDTVAVAHIKDNNVPLRMIDETGMPITGYRIASSSP